MKTDNLSWFDALYHVRAGMAITRDAWNDPEKRVYLDVDGDGVPDTLLLEYDIVHRHRNNYAMKLDARSIAFLEYIYLARPGQDPQRAYHPIQEDYIATDWRVIFPDLIIEEPVSHEE